MPDNAPSTVETMGCQSSKEMDRPEPAASPSKRPGEEGGSGGGAVSPSRKADQAAVSSPNIISGRPIILRE